MTRGTIAVGARVGRGAAGPARHVFAPEHGAPSAQFAQSRRPGRKERALLYKSLASLAFALILAGWTQRHHRGRHVPLVVAGIVIDVALVLILEFGRDVIGLTMTKEFSWLQWTHIGSSVVAVLLYIPVIVLGVRLLRGTVQARGRRAHRSLAQIALIARTIGFLCMWTV